MWDRSSKAGHILSDPGRRTAWVALGLSGAASLGHQLLWTRRMTDLLGAGSETTARVIGCFFLGMALGSALASRLLPRIRDRWRWASGLECATVVLSLPVAWVPAISERFWPWLGREALGSGWLELVRLLLGMIFILPPAMAVGMSLPVILGAVLPKTPREVVRLYAVYTLGGAIGLAWVVGRILPAFGVLGSMVVMMGLNLAAAVCCAVRAAGVRAAPSEGSVPQPASSRPPSSGRTPGWALAFFSGFGILAVEVLAIELVNLTAPLAFYPQASVLISALVMLAGAAFGAAWLVPRIRDVPRILTWILALSGFLAATGPLIFVKGLASRVALGYSDTLMGFWLQMTLAGWVSLGGVSLMGGMVFPLLLAQIPSDRPDRVARWLAINGLGGILGAECAIRLLLPIAGVHIALGLVGCLYALASLGWAWIQRGEKGSRWMAPSVSLVCCGVLLLGPLSSLRVFIDAPAFEVLDVRSGRDGTLAVVEREGVGRGMIFNNQYLLGATGAQSDMERQAHIPLLLHPQPRRVAFLGLGTGITAAASLQHGAVESLDIVELSPMVAEAADRFFSDWNAGVSRDRRVRVVVDDARAFTSASVGQYDVVVGDLFTPWRPGEARLCVLEQFAAAKRALRGNGVFCQWLPMHQLTLSQFEVIAATFRSVFPRAYLFRNHFRNRSVPLALVGLAEGGLSWDIVESRAEAEAKRDHLKDPLCRHVEGVAMLFLGESPAKAAEGPIHTLANLKLELEAGRNLILKGYKAFLHGRSAVWKALVEQQVDWVEAAEELPHPLRHLPALGRRIGEQGILNPAGDRSSRDTQARGISLELPECIREDRAADWALWAADSEGE